MLRQEWSSRREKKTGNFSVNLPWPGKT